MGQHYVIVQGPGKALRLITNMNDFVGGDNVATEDISDRGRQSDKGRMASKEMDRLVSKMGREEILALLGSVMSLRDIVRVLEGGLKQYMEERWGAQIVEGL